MKKAFALIATLCLVVVGAFTFTACNGKEKVTNIGKAELIQYIDSETTKLCLGSNVKISGDYGEDFTKLEQYITMVEAPELDGTDIKKEGKFNFMVILTPKEGEKTTLYVVDGKTYDKDGKLTTDAGTDYVLDGAMWFMLEDDTLAREMMKDALDYGEDEIKSIVKTEKGKTTTFEVTVETDGATTKTTMVFENNVLKKFSSSATDANGKTYDYGTYETWTGTVALPQAAA